MPDDMELVEGKAGVGQFLTTPLMKAGDMSMLTDSICLGGQPWSWR
jgi:hypothetical protein